MRKNYRIFLLMLCVVLTLSFSSVQIVFADTAADGNSDAAEEVVISAPSGVKALSSGKTTIKVSWKKVNGAEKYQVYRYNSKSKTWKLAKTTANLSVKFTGLAKSTTYKYKVRAMAGGQKSDFSASVTSKTGVVTKISLNSSSEKMYRDQYCQLWATVTAKAPSKTVKWTSSNKKVVTVNSSGIVTAQGAGTATITAKAHNGAAATCKFTIYRKTYAECYQQEMLRLVNKFRAENGAGKLTYADYIQPAADLRAVEAWYWPELGHSRYTKNGYLDDCESVFDDLNLVFEYYGAGENLAWNSQSFNDPKKAASVYFNNWKNSPGHRANMLNKSITSMATAYVYNINTSKYAGASVQLFLIQ